MSVLSYDLRATWSFSNGQAERRPQAKPRPIHDSQPSRKVALLMVDDAETGRSLALGLAERGHDVGLVCPVALGEEMEGLVDEFQRMGCRLFLLPKMIAGRINMEDVLTQLLKQFGRLDVFIDLARADPKQRWRLETTVKSRLAQTIPVMQILLDTESDPPAN